MTAEPKTTITRERYEAALEAGAIRASAHVNRVLCVAVSAEIVGEAFKAAGIEVERTPEERLAEAERRVAELEAQRAAFAAAFKAWEKSPAGYHDIPDIVREHVPEVRGNG